MTDYTNRLVAVIRAAAQATANTAAAQQDVDPQGGAQTWTVALRQAGDVTSTVRAYWCSWALTTQQLQALRTRLIAAGFTTAEVGVVRKTAKLTFVPVVTAKAYLFEGEVDPGDGGWTRSEILAVLGLDILPLAADLITV